MIDRHDPEALHGLLTANRTLGGEVLRLVRTVDDVPLRTVELTLLAQILDDTARAARCRAEQSVGNGGAS
jgi:hypothetical protein